MATEKQIPKFAALLVEHQNLLGALLDEEMQWAIQNPREAIGLMTNGIKNRLKPKILELVEPKIIIPAIKMFVAKDNFIVDTGQKAKVRIQYLLDDFQKWFLNKVEVEENIPETVLSSHKFLNHLLDSEIISALGGEKCVETKLAHVYNLMSRQPNGETGLLLTNDLVSIFYVRDKNGILRTVSVRWSGHGWCLFANPVDYPHGWYAQRYVLSPQFFSES